MTTSIVTADSLLAIDIGTISTRAILFDVIGNQYRFIAAGTAPSTAVSPFMDIGEGLRRAIDQLHEVTGRIFFTSDEQLAMPSHPDGSGVDAFVLTMSAGPPIRIVAVGLLEHISLESAKNLAETMYGKVLETLSLNDRRKPEERIDAILAQQPDLIILAGGIEGGATISVRQMLEAIGLACFLTPKKNRPQVLFSGNREMVPDVKESLAAVVDLQIAPNIRPAINTEQLGPAKAKLTPIYKNIRAKQIYGISDVEAWTKAPLTPTATAFERMIRFLSKIYNQGVLGVDIGASSTTVAAGFSGESYLGVYPDFGLGESLSGLLDHASLEEIARWVHLAIPEGYIRDYLYNKAAFPASIAVTEADLAVEQAIARQAIRLSLKRLLPSLPASKQKEPGVMPKFEPIVVAGSVLTAAPTPGHAMLMVLDGVQPAGISTVLLDRNNLVAALGMAAEINPILAVQVLDSKAILNLGAVVAPIGVAKSGTSILRVQMQTENGNAIKREIRFGAIEVLPLPPGETATLKLQPLHRFDIGAGPGRGSHIKVGGGLLGIVIDARGRPIQLHGDPVRRQDYLKKWRWSIGN